MAVNGNNDEAMGVREREIMSPEQMAEHLGISRTFAYELLRTGAVPSFKLARLRRVRRSDVDQYVEQRLSDAQ